MNPAHQAPTTTMKAHQVQEEVLLVDTDTEVQDQEVLLLDTEVLAVQEVPMVQLTLCQVVQAAFLGKLAFQKAYPISKQR